MKPIPHRSWLIFLVALVVGCLAAVGIQRYLRLQVADIEARGKARKTVRLVVPKDDLPKGALLSADQLAVREVPAEWASSNAVLPEQVDRVENQRLAYPVVHGEPLLWSLLEGERAPTFSSRLAIGRRAITLPVDEVNSISGMLEPGDHVDLMVSLRRENRAYLFPLLQNMAVLAAGSRSAPAGDGDGSRRSYSTITLEVTPADAQRLLAAREVGKIAAVLRPPGDAATSLPERRDAMALLGIGEPVPARSPEAGVPVLYGGGSVANLRDVPPLPGAGPAPTGSPAAAMSVAPAAPSAVPTQPLPSGRPGDLLAGGPTGASR